MDIASLSSMNSQLTNFLATQKSALSSNLNKVSTSNSSQSSTGIVLAKKGDSGYIEAMDADGDGEITFEEFNDYCEANGVSMEEKIKLASLMIGSKTQTKLVTKAAENQEEIASDESDSQEEDENEQSIYAKKGDDKYNEVMDTNKNGIVTYQEYMEYCNKRAKDSEQNNSSENKATQTYSQNEHYNDEPEITVEAEA